tara:strand:+ start:334 stop:618 length:285 start_codon:yes stop_codon:yes gene_type:complete
MSEETKLKEGKSCWICDGPVPNEKCEGQYEVKSLLKKDEEICTFCANTERHAALLNAKLKVKAKKLRDEYNLDGWKKFINANRETVRTMYGRGR